MTTSDEMGTTFCHDHIQHPLMWCEEKKRLIERKNAEESLRMWRRRKAEELTRKEKEKQEYYEMIAKHYPWGRPGGGAPNIDIRRKDITELGLHSTTPVTTAAHRFNSVQSCRFGDYFLRHKKCLDPLMVYQAHPNNPLYHAHANPQVHHQHQHHHEHQNQYLNLNQNQHQHQHQHQHSLSHSQIMPHHHHDNMNNDHSLNACNDAFAIQPIVGSCDTTATDKNCESLKITLKDHPALSFRNKSHLDIEVRYKPPPLCKGKAILERVLVTDNNSKCPLLDKRCDSLMDKKLEQTKKKVTPSFEKSEKVEKICTKDPWGKAGPGGKPWRNPKSVGQHLMKSLGWTNKEMLKDLDQDNPDTPAERPTFRKSRLSTKKLTKCCNLCTCNCPAASASNNPLNNPLNSLKKPINSLESKQQKIHSRFMQQNCHKQQGRGNGIGTGIEDGKCHDSTTDQSAKINSTTIDTTNTTAMATDGDGVELVPLLARRRACQRPISLSSTDITKQNASNDRLNTAAADLRYLHDLNKQVAQKRRSTSMARQLDRELCHRHFAAFDTFWGRPGHGAPSNIIRKLKLNYLLYGDNHFD